MNTTNPYESKYTKPDSHSSPWIGVFAAGLWITIPGSVLSGRILLLPMFDDFGLDLPASSQSVLSFWSPVVLAICCFVVLLAMFTLPYGTTRRRFIRLAGISGMLLGVLCVLPIIIPLSSLWRDLN